MKQLEATGCPFLKDGNVGRSIVELAIRMTGGSLGGEARTVPRGNDR